jgi:Cu2+-exporting ATPase
MNNTRNGLHELNLRITGMHCGACANVVESAVSAIPEIGHVSVSAATQRAQVQWQSPHIKSATILAAIRAAGYDAVPDTMINTQQARLAEKRQLLWRLLVAWFVAVLVMILATPAYVADKTPDGISTLDGNLQSLLNGASWVLCLPLIFFSAAPFFQSAYQALRHRRINMNVPVAIGIAVMFGVSTAATLNPSGTMGGDVYFDSLGMFLGFLLLSQWLELRLRQQAEQQLEEATHEPLQKAMKLGTDGHGQWVDANTLQVGDRVRIMLGQVFPVDGQLLLGTTHVSESLLTGESSPIPKTVGDKVYAGSLNQTAPVEIKTTQVAEATRFASLQALTRQAAQQRPVMKQAADAFAAPFLWAVLLLACTAGGVWYFIDPARAWSIALAVLIVTCPCALALAAPLSWVAATSQLMRHGIMLRKLSSLDAMAKVNHLFLDKTGTLTLDELELVAVHEYTPQGMQSVKFAESSTALAALQACAGMASWSAHPLTLALVKNAQQQSQATTPSSAVWHDVHETPGMGLEGRDDQGRVWRCGRLAWVQNGVPTAAKAIDGTTLWWGPIGQAQWCFEWTERLRPHAAEAINQIKNLGICVQMLSGDRAARVAHLAQQLGLDVAASEALPQDKLNCVKTAQAQGHIVAMVGDGLNDAPVLAQADVSFAMSEGASTSQASADAVVLDSTLLGIPQAFKLARKTQMIIRQNLTWAAVYNFTCIPLALMGWLPAWAAGIGMALSSLLVMLNTRRLLRPI